MAVTRQKNYTLALASTSFDPCSLKCNFSQLLNDFKNRLFSFSSQVFPILNISELFFQNQVAQTPFRKVGKSLGRNRAMK